VGAGRQRFDGDTVLGRGEEGGTSGNRTKAGFRGRVVIDLFRSRSCLTTDTEAQRVRDVAAELGDSVLLREYCSDDPEIRSRYGISRAIFIDGREVGWGYEAPKEGLREEITKAMTGDGAAASATSPGG
jgi:hypothetical protein